MSVIFGIFNLDGQPVQSPVLQCMQKALEDWGRDGAGTWCDGPVGLGHLLLHDTPESRYENQPLRHASASFVLSAGARLDNRADLLHLFGISPAEHAQTPDSVLILHAYERWGTECPAHLLGDWAFAVWDAQRRQLFLARDHYGATALYYYQDQSQFIFASSLKGLLAVPGLPHRLNPAALAQSGGGFHADATTPYEGIRLLTPAQALTVTATQTDLRHYWQPADAPDVRFGSDQAYLEAFLELYGEAVRCRLRSLRPIGILLSGGLDSGSIATLAASELAQRGQPLYAFSSVPLYDVHQATSSHRVGNEGPWIEATCRMAGNIELTYIKAEEVTPLNALMRSLDIFDRPTSAPPWGMASIDAAKARGIGVLLDGWGGNLTISWPGNRQQYLTSLFREGNYRRLLHEVAAWRTVHQATWMRTIASQVLQPLLPPLQKEQWQRFMQRGQRRVLKKTAIQAIAQRHPLIKIDPIVTNASNRGLYAFFRNGHTAGAFEMGAAFGLAARQPATDKRLIEFCMGIPLDQHMRHGGERLLVRRAMKGLMPDEVLWYKQRGLQNADLGQRIYASRGEIEAALHAMASSALVQQYLDLPYLNDLLRQTLENPAVFKTRHGAQRLLRGLSLGLFLRQFEHG